MATGGGTDQLTVIAFVLGAVGTTTGVLALAWNIVVHYLTSGRPHVAVDGAWLRDSGYGTVPLESFADAKPVFADGTPALLVAVSNRGRQPIVVTQCGVALGKVKAGVLRDRRNPAMPARVDPGGQALWVFELADVSEAIEGAVRQGEPGLVRAYATFGDRESDTRSKVGIAPELLRRVLDRFLEAG